MQQAYRDFVWTNHARDRALQRGLTAEEVWVTLKSPDHSEYASTKGAFEFVKVVGKKKISVVASKNSQGQWVIMSTWANPIWGSQSTAYRGGGWFDRMLESLLRKLFGGLQRKAR